MARKQQADGSLLDALSRTSPLLAEAAPLLAEASTPAAGLPALTELKAKPKVVGAIRADLDLARQLGSPAATVAAAAPDVAVLAPAVAIAASAGR